MTTKVSFFLFNLLLLGCKATKPLYPTVSINPYDVVSSPLLVEVNSMGIWHAFEGALGYVELIDTEGTALAMGFLTTKEEWMTSGPVMFQTTLEFDTKGAESGILIVHNNPGGGSGDEAGEEISFELPVRFKP